MVKMGPKELEAVLTRLAEIWHKKRTGQPGFEIKAARRAVASLNVKFELDSSTGWNAMSTDQDIMGAFIKATTEDGWVEANFDSWDQGHPFAFGAAPRNQAQACLAISVETTQGDHPATVCRSITCQSDAAF